MPWSPSANRSVSPGSSTNFRWARRMAGSCNAWTSCSNPRSAMGDSCKRCGLARFKKSSSRLVKRASSASTIATRLRTFVRPSASASLSACRSSSWSCSAAALSGLRISCARPAVRVAIDAMASASAARRSRSTRSVRSLATPRTRESCEPSRAPGSSGENVQWVTRSLPSLRRSVTSMVTGLRPARALATTSARRSPPASEAASDTSDVDSRAVREYPSASIAPWLHMARRSSAPIPTISASTLSTTRRYSASERVRSCCRRRRSLRSAVWVRARRHSVIKCCGSNGFSR